MKKRSVRESSQSPTVLPPLPGGGAPLPGGESLLLLYPYRLTEEVGRYNTRRLLTVTSRWIWVQTLPQSLPQPARLCVLIDSVAGSGMDSVVDSRTSLAVSHHDMTPW